jgi:conjugal transfer/entry exclusion protein
VPYAVLKKWAQVLGTTVAELEEEDAEQPAVDPSAPYAELHKRLDWLANYCEVSAPTSASLLTGRGLPGPSDVTQMISVLRRKPNIVPFGGFDAAKSRTCNNVLGGNYLPTKYGPATRLVTVVRHIDDRPDFVRDVVWIMGPNFDLTRTGDADHCTRNCIAAGPLETLRNYGTHTGRNKSAPAKAALVFVDSPLLRACNIIDLPGFRAEREMADDDARLAESAFGMADAIVYTSPANHFLNGIDLTYLGQLVRALPPLEADDTDFPVLGNLFVVATHAHPKIFERDLKELLDGAAQRLFDRLHDTALADRSRATGRAIELSDIRARFFSFWAETPVRSSGFRDALRRSLGRDFPRATDRLADRELIRLRTSATKKLQTQIDAYQNTLRNLADARQRYEALLADEPSRRARTAEKRARVEESIERIASNTRKEWQDTYASVVNSDYIETLIGKRFSVLADGKAQAKEFAPGYVLELLQGKLGEIAQAHTRDLPGEIDEFLNQYGGLGDAKSFGAVEIPFDARGAFLGGFAGAGVAGALALWVSTLGNLGGYILAAKAVSLLSAVGVSVSGGTAGAVALMSALGGPVTIGVGLFVAVGLLAWGLLGESWESRLAKKIVKEFSSQDVSTRFSDALEKYWRDGLNAFRKAADKVEEQYQQHLQYLERLVTDPSSSKEQLERDLAAAQEVLGFFANMPWRVT